MIHSHQKAIVVLAVVFFLFDNRREKGPVPPSPSLNRYCMFPKFLGRVITPAVADRLEATALDSAVLFLSLLYFTLIFKKDFIYFEREDKGGRKRGRETAICGCLSHAPHWGTWPTTQACALTGNGTSDPFVRRPALNPLSHTSQGYS